ASCPAYQVYDSLKEKTYQKPQPLKIISIYDGLTQLGLSNHPNLTTAFNLYSKSLKHLNDISKKSQSEAGVYIMKPVLEMRANPHEPQKIPLMLQVSDFLEVCTLLSAAFGVISTPKVDGVTESTIERNFPFWELTLDILKETGDYEFKMPDSKALGAHLNSIVFGPPSLNTSDDFVHFRTLSVIFMREFLRSHSADPKKCLPSKSVPEKSMSDLVSYFKPLVNTPQLREANLVKLHEFLWALREMNDTFAKEASSILDPVYNGVSLITSIVVTNSKQLHEVLAYEIYHLLGSVVRARIALDSEFKKFPEEFPAPLTSKQEIYWDLYDLESGNRRFIYNQLYRLYLPKGWSHKTFLTMFLLGKELGEDPIPLKVPIGFRERVKKALPLLKEKNSKHDGEKSTLSWGRSLIWSEGNHSKFEKSIVSLQEKLEPNPK
ncbi:MAG: hypothetical protein ACPGXY_01890, partial [Alphaproteobacteria bacterium]